MFLSSVVVLQTSNLGCVGSRLPPGCLEMKISLNSNFQDMVHFREKFEKWRHLIEIEALNETKKISKKRKGEGY